MIEILSPSGDFSCRVYPEFGGRLGSVTLNGTQLLITHPDRDDPLSWGCYPMVPYAGRIRNAQLTWNGDTHQLPVNSEPHSIHGTVFNQPWIISEHSSHSVSMICTLGDQWPYGASVRHDVVITNDELRLTLTVTAFDTMPIQVGWHPWFVKPQATSLEFAAMLPRDSSGIATSQQISHSTEMVDDCFVKPIGALIIDIGFQTLILDSDCTHWVVYDLPTHATCIEPQSGAPNASNDQPELLVAQQSFQRYFSWRPQMPT